MTDREGGVPACLWVMDCVGRLLAVAAAAVAVAPAAVQPAFVGGPAVVGAAAAAAAWTWVRDFEEGVSACLWVMDCVGGLVAVAAAAAAAAAAAVSHRGEKGCVLEGAVTAAVSEGVRAYAAFDAASGAAFQATVWGLEAVHSLVPAVAVVGADAGSAGSGVAGIVVVVVVVDGAASAAKLLLPAASAAAVAAAEE